MKVTASVLAALLLVAACGPEEKKRSSEEAKPEPKGSSAASASPGGGAAPGAAAPAAGGGVTGPATVDGAKAIIADLQKATDAKAAFTKLTPGLDDLKAIYSDAAVAADVKAHVDKLMTGTSSVEKGDAEVFCFSSDDVKAWKPDVEKHFPGGYKRVGAKLAAGLTLCKFKAGGTSYDALVNSGGKWFFVPKSFRVIKE